jgi:hypothetical protein
MKRIYYDSEKKCKEHNKYDVKESEINIRYKNFKHTIFTAGDVEQFYKRCGEINEEINHTFLYLFHKFKKGIFVRIQDNKVETFIPFSKKNYINEWSNLVKITDKYSNFSMNRYNKDLDGLMNFISKQTGYHKTRYLNDIDLWYSNNCLVRNENPISEGESGVLEIKDMLDNLCKNKKIKDVYFFINKRDFPLIKKNRTESYNYIFGDNTPLLSHNYKDYCKILSMCSKDGYEDIPIPTWEDWCRVSSKYNKFFPKNCRNYNYNFVRDWSKKRCMAVFRGASTGNGINENTNMRIKISLSKNKYIDAGITKWNLRPRLNKIGEYTILDTIDNRNLPSKINSLTPEQQSCYKYIINIDGHSSAFRLSLELSMGSVILFVESEYYLWFKNFMIPYVHYIPIKKDLSDIDEKIEWCINNDKECEKIGKNSIEFYNTFLCENSIYSYLETLINNIPVKPLQKTYKIFDYNNIICKSVDITTTIKKDFFLKRLCYQQKSFSKYISNFSTEYFSKISENKNITLYNNNNIFYITKSVKNKFEALIGLKYINNLYKRIPNFMYTYKCSDTNIYLEYIKGIEFQTWLKDFFDFDKYIFILLQIILAIHVAQEYCDFIHYDLSPWNIILYEYPEEIDVYYQIKHTNKFVKIKTKIVPVIIDYGKSSVNKYYMYNINKHNFIIDIIFITIKSINTIIQNNISQNTFYNLNLLISFFYEFTPTFSNIYSFRKFIKSRSKYDNLINLTQKTTTKTSIDFFYYIINNFSIPHDITHNLSIYNSDYPLFHYYNILNKPLIFNNFIDNIPKGNSTLSSLYIYNKIINILTCNNCPEHYIKKIHTYFKFIDLSNLTHIDHNPEKIYELMISPIIDINFKKNVLSN